MPTPTETIEERLASYWRLSGAEAERKAQEPYVPPALTPSLLGIPGTLVRVVGVDHDWNGACAGHPVIGSEGIISETLSPDGKTCVEFRGDAQGALHVTRGGAYTGLGEENPIRLYLIDDTLAVVS
jgi:hypothetical protein